MLWRNTEKAEEMEFRKQRGTISFEEAERRYAELKRCHEAGEINDEQFDAERQGLLVVDDEGNSWAKSRQSGQWLYHDGSAWIESTPPVYRRVGSADSPERAKRGPSAREAGSSGLLIGSGILCAVLAVGLIAALAYALTGEEVEIGPKTILVPAPPVAPPNAPPKAVSQQEKPGEREEQRDREDEPTAVQEQKTAQEDSGSEAEAAAAQAVEDFYTSAAEGDYGRSSELLTASARRRYFPSGNFEKTFATLKKIRFTEGPTAEVSGETATVTGTTIAEHADRTEQNGGTWTLVNEKGQWKLDDWDVQLERYL